MKNLFGKAWMYFICSPMFAAIGLLMLWDKLRGAAKLPAQSRLPQCTECHGEKKLWYPPGQGHVCNGKWVACAPGRGSSGGQRLSLMDEMRRHGHVAECWKCHGHG